MRQIPQPVVDDVQLFDNIIAAKHGDRRTRLRSIRGRVLDSYRRYAAAAPDVEQLPVVRLTAKQREALIHGYESETAPLAELRKLLIQPISLVRCPFCGLSEASQLDHYLPKEQHPQFSVYSKNLVPCCSPCNTRKSQGVLDVGTSVRLFLHPYFDSIPDARFITLKIRLLVDAIGLAFQMRRPAGMDPQTFHHLSSHFNLLGLADRYRRMSLDDLRSRRHDLERDYGRNRNAARVSAELLQSANDFETDFGPNYWKAILYRSLADHDDFCDGGFRVLNRIQ